MKDELHIDCEALMVDIVRYLAVVDAFRAASCEPFWRPELTALAIDRDSERRSRPIERALTE
jgi:hypothetical protein